MNQPKLRQVHKHKPPYKLNNFSKKFILNVAKDIVYFLATRQESRLEGQDWEEIFARAIGATWKPSNIGFDDVILKNCAWSAKSVKIKNPSKVTSVRLISGRNSPIFSFGETIDLENSDPQDIGDKVLSIWNTRVEDLYLKYPFLRTVVIVKSDDLCELAIFEFETVRYEPSLYRWKWNKRKNLEGFDENDNHKFTWQPHGSQFTIKEKVPKDRIAFKIKKPEKLQRKDVLQHIGFDESWISIIK